MKTFKILVAILFLSVSGWAQNAIKTTGTLAGLKLLTPDPQSPLAFVGGWTTNGDGGWNIYLWNASSALSTNYAIVASDISTKTVTNNGVTTTLYLSGYGGQWIRMDGGGGKPPRIQTLAADTTVLAEAASIRVVGTGGATTLSNNPIISVSGVSDGQEIRIEGTSDTNTVIFTDGAGQALNLGASTRTVGKGDVLSLKYNATDALWYEIGFVNN